MTTHTCDNRCSWKQTEDNLRDLGFELAELRRDATAMDKLNHERTVANALYQAMARGLVRGCTKTDRVWDHVNDKAKV